MIELPFWILAGISLVALVIGSITDIKKREVPDFLNFSLIILGVIIGGILSILNWSIWPVLTAIGGLISGYLIAAAMYYTGQWGGGDAKMLMGLGALHGVAFLGPYSFITHKVFPFFFTLIITIMVAGAIYSLCYLIGLILVKWKPYRRALRKKLREKAIRQQRWIALAIVVIASISILILPDTQLRILIGTFATLVVLGLYSGLLIKTAEKALMIKKISVNKLVEGDWIAKEIKVKDEIICGPKTLGVEEKHIALLKKKGIKEVYVKEGVPFIPGFLLGYIMMLILGNWMNIMFILLF